MTFVKEGKEMNYGEVVQLVVEVSKRGVLEKLEKDEIAGFMRRLFRWHTQKLMQFISPADNKIRGERDLLEAANELHMIGDKRVWKKGEMLLAEIEQKGNYEKEDLIQFIQKDLLKELQEHSAAMNQEEEQLLQREMVM